MICAAVFETDGRNRRQLKEWIGECLIQAGMDMDVLWFTQGVSEERIVEYAADAHLALVSLDDAAGIAVGERLYQANPSCRIFYYSDKRRDLRPLLSTRPVCFYCWREGKDIFQQRLKEVLNELSAANDIFHYETKRELFLVPYRNILYLQSDLKYVRICILNGAEHRVCAKLSQLEPKLGGRFVRIHKSYIVNSCHVDYLDKKNHTVRLLSGEILPISNAQYDAASARFRALKMKMEKRSTP